MVVAHWCETHALVVVLGPSADLIYICCPLACLLNVLGTEQCYKLVANSVP